MSSFTPHPPLDFFFYWDYIACRLLWRELHLYNMRVLIYEYDKFIYLNL